MDPHFKPETEQHLAAFFTRHPELSPMRDQIVLAIRTIAEAFANGHKLLLCGNGGSCADCDHIAGELLKGFLKKRPISSGLRAKLLDDKEGAPLAEALQQGLPAISLCTHSAAISAFANDVEAKYVYAQQVLAYRREGDILLAISTSGNAKNVNAAAITAKAMGLFVIGLTGKTGGSLADKADLLLSVPETETNRIQEYHLMVYHLLCASIESELFDS